MKKALNLTGAVLAALILLASGCSVDKVNPPITVGTTGSGSVPTTVLVSLSSSAIASGTGTAAVTATVTNASAQVVPNVSVAFTVISATAGSFTPATAVTNASGQAVSTFSAAAVNTTATIRATVTLGTGTISGTAQITIGTPPQVPTSVAVALGSSTIANPPGPGNSTTVTATVTGASGPISGYTVSFTTSVAGAGTFTAAAPTDAAGQTTVTFTASVSDTVTDITATAGTVSNSAQLTIGTVPPPTPASMSITITPLTMSILGQATVSVTLLDASGNPAYNNPVTLTITAGTTLASFNPMPSSVFTVPLTTNTSGVASAIIYSGASSGTVTVEATSGALTPKSASVLIASSPASLTLNVVNSNLVSNQTTNITADVRNLANNPVSDGTVVNFSIVSLPPVAGTLSATQASTVNGIASVTFTADVSLTGGVIIQASAGTVPPVQAIIIVSAAQAGSIEFVSAAPSVINIVGAGTSSSTVTFKVLSVAGAPLASQSVNFTLFGPTGATLTGGGTTASGSTNQQGEVTTILQAGLVAGPCRIVATTTVPGPPVAILAASSGGISIGGGVPSDRFFSTSVTKLNIDGLNCDNVQSTINVLLADRFGNYNILQGTSVSFATDSGAIDTSNTTDDKGATTAVYRSQAPRPTDVAPQPGEPSYTVGPRTYNPRDGWLTILVSTTGEEYFQDDNANGIYNVGEPFIDLPEPFIDSDDSGSHDAGELFFDWPAGVSGNTTGSYDVPNGVWDAKIPIFREVNLVMTGPPDITDPTEYAAGKRTSRIELSTGGIGNISIPRGTSATFYVYVSDINMNALISGTKVSAASDKTEAKVAFVGGSETLGDGLSFGPARVAYSVTNNNTSSPAVSVFPTLSATIDWPGSCGGVKVTIPYPGLITLP